MTPPAVERIGDWDCTPEDVDAAKARLGSADSVVTCVLGIAGARALALDALFRVSAIEWSGEIRTAMVECAERPRMLVNPAFVERWCHTPERFAALLLHELSHVSMGHTRLYPRPTIAHNVAFDAIINRELLATADDAYANVDALGALFVDLYAPDESPEFLLRPPPGWPDAPDWDASRKCAKDLRQIHRRLYMHGVRTPLGAPASHHLVTYSEIVAALAQLGLGGAGGGVWIEADGDILKRLLGAHGNTERERTGTTGGRDASAGSVFGNAMGPLWGHLAGEGGVEQTIQIAKAERRASLQRALRTLLTRVANEFGTHARIVNVDERRIVTADFSRDRRAPARIGIARAFGAPRPLLFESSIDHPRRAPREALIYLDVSGSMGQLLPILHASLVPLRRELRPRIFAFSTEVMPVVARDFDRGRLPTTGGTSVTPVLEHAVRHAEHASPASQETSVIVLTDGYFSEPTASLVRAVRARRIRVHLAVAGPGDLHANAAWVASATRLPAFNNF